MTEAYRIGAALAVWSGLILQYALMAKGREGGALVEATVNFFSYFTILSNILAALCLTMPWLAPRSAAGRFFADPSVRTAAALYMTVTGTIYVLVLRHLWAPQGLQWVADTLLHYVAPVLFVFDWLALSPKRTLPWRSVLAWLLFPLAFGAYSLVRGSLSGFYPYPFIDAGALGLPHVLANMAILVAAFFVLGLLFVAIRRHVGRPASGPLALSRSG